MFTHHDVGLRTSSTQRDIDCSSAFCHDESDGMHMFFLCASTQMKFTRVKISDEGVLKESAQLLTAQYGKDSRYSEWIQNGFRPYSIDYLKGQITNTNRELWVMMDGNKVVGTIVIQRVPDSGYVIFHKFAVALGYTGKGIGERILKRAEARVQRQGFQRMRVEVFTPAIRLTNYYIKQGYTNAIEVKLLDQDEHTRYVCKKGSTLGFLTLEKKRI